MTTFLTTFNRLFAFLTAALLATVLVATVATLAGVHVGAPAPEAPVAMTTAPTAVGQTMAAAVHPAAADNG